MQVAFKKVEKLLKKCADGYQLKGHPHFIAVLIPREDRIPSERRSRERDNHQIEVGYIRRMARTLGIEECAKAYVRLD